MNDRDLLPVQCCCEPGKRLGWVYVPNARRGAVMFLAAWPTFAEWPRYLEGDVTSIPTITAQIEWHVSVPYPAVLLDCGHYSVALKVKRLAVNSHDQPLEVWRRVPGFIERPSFAGRR